MSQPQFFGTAKRGHQRSQSYHQWPLSFPLSVQAGPPRVDFSFNQAMIDSRQAQFQRRDSHAGHGNFVFAPGAVAGGSTSTMNFFPPPHGLPPGAHFPQSVSCELDAPRPRGPHRFGRHSAQIMMPCQPTDYVGPNVSSIPDDNTISPQQPAPDPPSSRPSHRQNGPPLSSSSSHPPASSPYPSASHGPAASASSRLTCAEAGSSPRYQQRPPATPLSLTVEASPAHTRSHQVSSASKSHIFQDRPPEPAPGRLSRIIPPRRLHRDYSEPTFLSSRSSLYMPSDQPPKIEPYKFRLLLRRESKSRFAHFVLQRTTPSHTSVSVPLPNLSDASRKLKPFPSKASPSMSKYAALLYLLLCDLGLNSILTKITPTKDEKKIKVLTVQALAALLKEHAGDQVQVFTTGSTAYDADSIASDLDLVLMTSAIGNPLEDLKIVSRYISETATRLKAHQTQHQCVIRGAEVQCTDVDFVSKWPLLHAKLEVVHTARVPILVIKFPLTGLLCDVSVNAENALSHTHFFQQILNQKSYLRGLMRFVKHWTKIRHLPSTREGGLPNIVWMILCVVLGHTTEICYARTKLGGALGFAKAADPSNRAQNDSSSSSSAPHMPSPVTPANLASPFTHWIKSLSLPYFSPTASYFVLLGEFFSRLCSRQSLSTRVSIQQGSCLPKVDDTASKKLATPSFYIGVWDELLFVEDPAYCDTSAFTGAVSDKSTASHRDEAGGIETRPRVHSENGSDHSFHNLASKISSATWLVYQYELRRSFRLFHEIVYEFYRFQHCIATFGGVSTTPLLIVHQANKMTQLLAFLYEGCSQKRYLIPAQVPAVPAPSKGLPSCSCSAEPLKERPETKVANPPCCLHHCFCVSASQGGASFLSVPRKDTHPCTVSGPPASHTGVDQDEVPGPTEDPHDNESDLSLLHQLPPLELASNAPDGPHGIALVLLYGRLHLVRITKVCVDVNSWWSSKFLSRRDIKSVLHGVPLYSVLVLKSKYFMHNCCSNRTSASDDSSDPSEAKGSARLRMEGHQKVKLNPIWADVRDKTWILMHSEDFSCLLAQVKQCQDGLATFCKPLVRRKRVNWGVPDSSAQDPPPSAPKEILFNPCNIICLFQGTHLQHRDAAWTALLPSEVKVLTEILFIASMAPYWYETFLSEDNEGSGDPSPGSPVPSSLLKQLQPAAQQCRHCSQPGISDALLCVEELGLVHQPVDLAQPWVLLRHLWSTSTPTAVMDKFQREVSKHRPSCHYAEVFRTLHVLVADLLHRQVDLAPKPCLLPCYGPTNDNRAVCTERKDAFDLYYDMSCVLVWFFVFGEPLLSYFSVFACSRCAQLELKKTSTQLPPPLVSYRSEHKLLRYLESALNASVALPSSGLKPSPSVLNDDLRLSIFYDFLEKLLVGNKKQLPFKTTLPENTKALLPACEQDDQLRASPDAGRRALRRSELNHQVFLPAEYTLRSTPPQCVKSPLVEHLYLASCLQVVDSSPQLRPLCELSSPPNNVYTLACNVQPVYSPFMTVPKIHSSIVGFPVPDLSILAPPRRPLFDPTPPYPLYPPTAVHGQPTFPSPHHPFATTMRHVASDVSSPLVKPDPSSSQSGCYPYTEVSSPPLYGTPCLLYPSSAFHETGTFPCPEQIVWGFSQPRGVPQLCDVASSHQGRRPAAEVSFSSSSILSNPAPRQDAIGAFPKRPLDASSQGNSASRALDDDEREERWFQSPNSSLTSNADDPLRVPNKQRFDLPRYVPPNQRKQPSLGLTLLAPKLADLALLTGSSPKGISFRGKM